MQRAICRIIRGNCKKIRDANDCPIVASEEVRQKQSSSNQNFSSSRKYTVFDAIGWTTGLILTYEVTNFRRRHLRSQTIENQLSFVKSKQNEQTSDRQSKFSLYIRNCPFAIAKSVIAQPMLTGNHVRSIHTTTKIRASSSSIDTTPFLQEPEVFLTSINDTLSKESTGNDDDDETVFFDATLSKFDELRSNPMLDHDTTTLAEKLTSDLFSILGSFKFLSSFRKESVSDRKLTGSHHKFSKGNQICNNLEDDNGPVEALDLLEKGVELGSSRALYNMGVAYERLNEFQLSEEYFNRAAQLGHPLASYNVAVKSIKDGDFKKAFKFLEYAAKKGVKEAKDVIHLKHDAFASQDPSS